MRTRERESKRSADSKHVSPRHRHHLDPISFRIVVVVVLLLLLFVVDDAVLLFSFRVLISSFVLFSAFLPAFVAVASSSTFGLLKLILIRRISRSAIHASTQIIVRRPMIKQVGPRAFLCCCNLI